MPGMPLIYTGQEYDVKKRLKFFEQDAIDKNTGHMFAVYEKLGKLKNENPALNGGKKPASFKLLPTSDTESVLAFEREKDGRKVIFVANLKPGVIGFNMPVNGTYTNYMTGEKVTFKGQKVEANGWQYWILTN